MEFSIVQKPEKKRRSSFWFPLRGLNNRKSKLDSELNPDVTLVSANPIYSSFRGHQHSDSNSKSSYATFETHQLDKADNGILFLTSDNQLRWKNQFTHRPKHVKFASPTPDRRRNTPEYFGKENTHSSRVEHSQQNTPGPGRDETLANCGDLQKNTLPRTSTKKKLRELPNFNVSNIHQVNPTRMSLFDSLRRIQKEQKTLHKSILVKTQQSTENQALKPDREQRKPTDVKTLANKTTFKKPADAVQDGMQVVSARSRRDSGRQQVDKNDPSVRPCRCGSLNRQSQNHHLMTQKGNVAYKNMGKTLSDQLRQKGSSHRNASPPYVNVQKLKGQNFPSYRNCCYQEYFLPEFIPKSSNFTAVPVDSYRNGIRQSTRGNNGYLTRSSSAHARSSPTRTRKALKNRPMSAKYDGMSSMADDERSLKLSEEDCEKQSCSETDEKKEWRGRLNVERRNSNCPPPVDKMLPFATFGKPVAAAWYKCNETSPVSIPQTKNTKTSTAPQPARVSSIYESQNFIISNDYDVDHKMMPTDSKSKIDSATRRDSCLKNQSDNSRNFNRQSLHDDVCVSRLQEALNNIFQSSGSQSSFSINRSENADTIVIQIQNKHGTSGLTDTHNKDAHVGSKDAGMDSNVRASHCVNQDVQVGLRCRSLPDLANKDVATTFIPSMTLMEQSGIEGNKEPSVDKKSPAQSCPRLPEGWNVSPTPEDNSGYSTLASDESSKETNTSTKTEEGLQKMLQSVINIGKGLTPGGTKRMLVNKSPRKYKLKANDVLSGKAKLKLGMYYNSGLVTIHVMKAVKLISVRTLTLNPYVKVSMHPDQTRRAHWRTRVVHNQNNPDFNQKFSFEIAPEDSKKRLIFSVWHRDLERKRSEFLGCMSFGVHHVLDSSESLGGWYRLLKEDIGTKKHFAAHHGKAHTFSKIMVR